MSIEPRGSEGNAFGFAQFKKGLETPLAPRLWRETRLVFAPPVWYDVLTWVCIVMGAWWFLSYFVMPLNVLLGALVSGGLKLFVGVSVFVAGVWGQLSSERMTCDLRTKTYARREGQGVFKSVTRGSLSELDALVAMTQTVGASLAIDQKPVIYRLVLHWKGKRRPLLVVYREQGMVPAGSQLNVGAGRMLHDGARIAKMLEVEFFDNTYFPSPEPQTAW